MSDFKDRAVPYDINAEAAVLSAMIIDSLSVLKSIDEVKEAYFHNSKHRVIFQVMVSLFQEQMEVDVITLLNRLESSGQLEKAGGKEYVLQIADIVVSGANFPYHCKILKEKFVLRELIFASNRIIERCYEGDCTGDELLDFAEQSVFQLYDVSVKKGFKKIGSHTTEVLRIIQDIASSKQHVHGVATEFRDLDRHIGGFRPGQLIILAARPGMGKSAFAINIARNAAEFHDMKIGIFTMEMSAEEVILRMISSISGIPLDYLTKGYGINQDRIRKITGIAEYLSEKHIYIDDAGTNTPLELRAKTRRLKSELKGLDLVIVDYLQLLSTAKKSSENRQQEISEISRNLKLLAKEMNVPVLALSQLNREVEKRDDKTPRLSDLRESGAIEQDADIVMFIHREDIFEKDSDKKFIAKIVVAKNRQGPQGKVELRFDPTITAFDNLEPVPASDKSIPPKTKKK